MARQLPLALLLLSIATAASARSPASATEEVPMAASGPASDVAGDIYKLVSQFSHAGSPVSTEIGVSPARQPVDLRLKDLDELFKFVKSKLPPAEAPATALLSNLDSLAGAPASAAAATTSAEGYESATPPAPSGAPTVTAASAVAVSVAAVVGYFLC